MSLLQVIGRLIEGGCPVPSDHHRRRRLWHWPRNISRHPRPGVRGPAHGHRSDRQRAGRGASGPCLATGRPAGRPWLAPEPDAGPADLAADRGHVIGARRRHILAARRVPPPHLSGIGPSESSAGRVGRPVSTVRGSRGAAPPRIGEQPPARVPLPSMRGRAARRASPSWNSALHSARCRTYPNIGWRARSAHQRATLTMLGRRAARQAANRGLSGSDWLAGVTDPICVADRQFWPRWLGRLGATTGSVEVCCHPGYEDPTLIGRDCEPGDGVLRRVREMDLLRDPSFQGACDRAGLAATRPTEFLMGLGSSR